MNKILALTIRITCLLIFLISFAVEAQVENDVIKKDFGAYLEAIMSKDFDASLDYLVEDVFDIVPREALVTVMEQTFNSEDIEFTFGEFTIDAIKEPIVIDSTSYVILNYTSNLSMRFVSPEDEEVTEEDKKMTRIITEAALEQQFGKENISYNESTEFFDIIALKQAVAVKKETYKQWKFLVVEKGQPLLLKAILPNEILEKVLTED